MGTRTCFDPDDSFGGQDVADGRAHVLGVLPREDVVGHHQRVNAFFDEPRDERLDEGRLAGANGSTDPDPRDPGRPKIVAELILKPVVCVDMRVAVAVNVRVVVGYQKGLLSRLRTDEARLARDASTSRPTVACSSRSD